MQSTLEPLMKPFKKILVPIDFSVHAEEATRIAIDLSKPRPHFQAPKPAAPLRFRGWDVRYHYAPMPDGQSFLMNVPIAGSTSTPMTFVMNW